MRRSVRCRSRRCASPDVSDSAALHHALGRSIGHGRNEWTGQADGVFRAAAPRAGPRRALVGFAERPTKPIRWKNVARVQRDHRRLSRLDRGRRSVRTWSRSTRKCWRRSGLHARPQGSRRRPAARVEAGWRQHIRSGSTACSAATFAIARNGDGVGLGLKLIAADDERRLLVLPEDRRATSTRHGAAVDPATFPISKAARMSMSIPYFLGRRAHLVVGADQQVGTGVVHRRRRHILSGWLFDSPNPTRPTFGFAHGRHRRRRRDPEYRRLLPWAARAGSTSSTAQRWTRFQTHSTQVRTLAVSATVATPAGRSR